MFISIFFTLINILTNLIPKVRIILKNWSINLEVEDLENVEG